MTQQRPNAYIVTLTPPMSTFYLEGKLMKVIQVSIKGCPRPTSDHVQLAGPPRRNNNKVTLTLEISPLRQSWKSAPLPSPAPISADKASEIAQREELNAQMSLLSVDLST